MTRGRTTKVPAARKSITPSAKAVGSQRAVPAKVGPSRAVVEARSYELDPYGHVNNSVFVNWLEHGRLSWLRDRGLTYTSIPAIYGVHVVVVSLKLDYKAEVLLGDRLVVVSDVVRVGRSSFTFEHRIEFELPRAVSGAGATESAVSPKVAAQGEVVMVATRDGRSAPIPDALRARFLSDRL